METKKGQCTILKLTLSISASSFLLSSCSCLTLAHSSEFSFISRSCALSFDRISSSDYNHTVTADIRSSADAEGLHDMLEIQNIALEKP